MVTKVLIANDEDKDKQIAKLEAACEDYEKAKKAMDEDHEKEVAKLKADLDDRIAEPGPVVKAIMAGMDDDKKEEAKKAAMDEIEKTAMDDEHKKEAKKAMEEIFDTGNGTNTNAMHNDHEKEEAKAVIASLSAKVSEPIINKILTAKTQAGATEDEIATEQKKLSAMTLPQIEKEFESNKIFINQQLTASQVNEGVESLTAAEEKGFDFNGINGPLTGKATDIDAIIDEATLWQTKIW